MASLGELIAPRRLGRDFPWLMTASWASNLGDGIALSAAPLLIASLTSSPLLVAAGAMMQFLPWLLFGLLAGSVADHHDRRRLVIVANAARAVVVMGLVVFLVTGHATVWVVLATAFLYGTAEVFADSAGSTLLPMLVRPADLGIGNARLQAGYLVANQLAGPPLGAFLFAIGSFLPFVLQILCVLLAIVLISRIARTPVPPQDEPEDGAKAHPIRDGLRWLRHNAPVRTLVLIILVFIVTWAAPWGVLVLYATEHLGIGVVGYGALTTATAIGGLIAVGSFGWLEKHVSFATLMRVCLALEVLMHLTFAFTTSSSSRGRRRADAHSAAPAGSSRTGGAAAMCEIGRQTSARVTAEPAKANHHGAVRPHVWARSPPMSWPMTIPPKTPTMLTDAMRPCSSRGTRRWRTVVEIVPHTKA